MISDGVRQSLIVEKVLREVESAIASARLERFDLSNEKERLERRISEEKERLARGRLA